MLPAPATAAWTSARATRSTGDGASLARRTLLGRQHRDPGIGEETARVHRPAGTLGEARPVALAAPGAVGGEEPGDAGVALAIVQHFLGRRRHRAHRPVEGRAGEDD